MNFKLSLEELVTVWQTTEVEVEADSLEQAIKEVLIGGGCYIDSNISEIIDYIEPSQVDGKATVKVYNKNKEVYSNHVQG